MYTDHCFATNLGNKIHDCFKPKSVINCRLMAYVLVVVKQNVICTY